MCPRKDGGWRRSLACGSSNYRHMYFSSNSIVNKDAGYDRETYWMSTCPQPVALAKKAVKLFSSPRSSKFWLERNRKRSSSSFLGEVSHMCTSTLMSALPHGCFSTTVTWNRVVWQPVISTDVFTSLNCVDDNPWLMLMLFDRRAVRQGKRHRNQTTHVTIVKTILRMLVFQ